ncbi:MAG: lysylphosphatidylglycerol synthase domain-containing protein [Bacteroidales bacterium]|nr:lysylphosphatidylglycerol synthase domain-containing protein [Bacteroidales bacterium]
MINNKAKIHKSYNYFINIIILLAAYFFIYFQIFYRQDLDSILSFFQLQIQKPETSILFTLVAILMPVNLGLESRKWQYLIRKIEKISFYKSFIGILTGITTSIFTPNRIGDFFGKVFILKNVNPWKAIFISILGSISQFIITFFIGSLGTMIFIAIFSDVSNSFSELFYYGLLSIILLVNIFLFLFYFNVSIITDVIIRIIPERWKRIRVYLRVFSYFSTKELLSVLLLSFLRYCVFNFQFFLLLRIFSIHIGLMESLMISSCIFFILAFIPSIALAELGIRGSVAIAVFSMFFENNQIYSGQYKLGAAAAITVLWLINIIIPALLGSMFVLKLKFFRK